MSKHLKHIEVEATAPLRHAGSVPDASLLFYGGRSHIVAHQSPAEHDLLERGALHVGMVRFERAPEPAAMRISRLPAVEAALPVLAWGSGRN